MKYILCAYLSTMAFAFGANMPFATTNPFDTSGGGGGDGGITVEVDPIYSADKAYIARMADIPDISHLVTEEVDPVWEAEKSGYFPLTGGIVTGSLGVTGPTVGFGYSTEVTVQRTPSGATDVVNKQYVDNQMTKIVNNSGQVKANYTTLSITGTVGNAPKIFPLGSSTPVISPTPTTIYPYGSVQNYNAMYDPVTQRLRENDVLGQVHCWRIQGTYSNKSLPNNGQLQIRMRNVNSGFVASAEVTLPAGLSSGIFTFEITTVADSASLSAGRGYILDLVTSFTDSNLVVGIVSILRISAATENMIVE